MAQMGKATVRIVIRLRMSLWDAFKLRVAGEPLHTILITKMFDTVDAALEVEDSPTITIMEE